MRFAPLTAAAMLAAPLLAMAQPSITVPDRQARAWAASCAACHGTGGHTQGAMPAIGGRDAEQMHRILLDFKNDRRPGATVMHQHAKGYTDDELRRIAQVLSREQAPR